MSTRLCDTKPDCKWLVVRGDIQTFMNLEFGDWSLIPWAEEWKETLDSNVVNVWFLYRLPVILVVNHHFKALLELRIANMIGRLQYILIWD